MWGTPVGAPHFLESCFFSFRKKRNLNWVVSQLPSSSKDLPWGLISHEGNRLGFQAALRVWYGKCIRSAPVSTICPAQYDMCGRCANNPPHSPPYHPPLPLWQHPPCCAAGPYLVLPHTGVNPHTGSLDLAVLTALSLWGLLLARLTFFSTSWWLLRFSPKKLFGLVLLL